MRRIWACLLLVCSLSGLGWGFWPPAAVSRTLGLNPALMPTSAPEESRPGISEGCRLTILYPSYVRSGDPANVRLFVDLVPAAQGSPVVDAVYVTHNMLAEARLELPGGRVTPPNLTGQPLLPNERLTFRWQVRLQQPGAYEGVLWFYLNLIARSGAANLDANRQALAAPTIPLQATTFLGLGGPAARGLGAAGFCLGLLLLLLPRLFPQRDAIH